MKQKKRYLGKGHFSCIFFYHKILMFFITNRHALITDLKMFLLGYKVLRLPRYEISILSGLLIKLIMLKTKLELPYAIRWFQFYSQCNKKRRNSSIQCKEMVLWFCHYFMFYSIFEAVSQNFFSIL